MHPIETAPVKIYDLDGRCQGLAPLKQWRVAFVKQGQSKEQSEREVIAQTPTHAAITYLKQEGVADFLLSPSRGRYSDPLISITAYTMQDKLIGDLHLREVRASV